MSTHAPAAVPTDLNSPSKAHERLDAFRHLYDRGEGYEFGHPSYTINQAADQIDRLRINFLDADRDGKTELTYSFTPLRPVDFDPSLGDFIRFSAQQEAQTRLVLKSWADVASLSFREAASGSEGHLSLANYSISHGEAAFAYYPYLGYGQGQSWYWVSDQYRYNADASLNSYGRQTLAHEIGHNLGLAHPGDYDARFGFPSYEQSAPYAEDSRAYSVMSYWGEYNTGANFAGAYASAPLLDDIAAIQLLYGANMQTRAGGTVYGFNSNSQREEMSALSNHDKLIFSVWDAGGQDTFDFSGYSANQRIDLHQGGFSDVGGLVGNVSIAQGVDIERAKGGLGNDLLVGNALANDIWGNAGKDVISGEGGADRLWGGAGADIFEYFTLADSAAAAPDRLMDFVSGQDRIDLSGLPVEGRSIHFASAFNGQDNVATLRDASYGSSLAIDFDGDRTADFAIRIIGHAETSDFLV